MKMEKLSDKKILGLESCLIEFARQHVEANEENILNVYNKTFTKKVKKLKADEFKTLAYYTNVLVKKLRKRKRDAIAEFVFKSQNTNYYKELIKHKGFYFAMFVKLLSDVMDAKV
jgi:hypothetical protein